MFGKEVFIMTNKELLVKILIEKLKKLESLNLEEKQQSSTPVVSHDQQ